MMTWSTLARFALAAAVPMALLVACGDSNSGGYSSTPSAGGGSGGTAGDGLPSQHPVLALVDTDQTMEAKAGEGVGVFTEYRHGGHWHIWWTCDSAVDTVNPACSFDVNLSTSTGTIANLAPSGIENGDTITQANGTSLEARTTVSTGIDSVDFDTTPGATITLSATVGGQYDGRFLFFVEQGNVDDGAKAPVTDPIQLVGTQP